MPHVYHGKHLWPAYLSLAAADGDIQQYGGVDAGERSGRQAEHPRCVQPGKAQRLLYNLAHTGKRFFVHGAIYNAHQVLLANGWPLPPVELITPETPKSEMKNHLIISPPSAADSAWMKKFAPYSLGICSGWMQVRGNTRRMNADAGFAISDHADWTGLLQSVRATGAEKVFVTHGFSSVLARYLQENDLPAEAVRTAYGGEEETTETTA